MTSYSVRALCRAAVAAVAFLGVMSTAQAQTKVRYIEVVRNFAYLPSYVALSKGFFKEQGLDVTLTTSSGGDKVTALLLSGSTDIALVGPEVAIYVWNSESPEKLKLFSGLTGTSTNFLVSREKIARADFKWSMIKGKRFLAWRPGATPQLFLEFALRKNGVDPSKDMTNITNIAVPARMGAWLTGTGDFAIFSEPELSLIERQGKGVAVAFIGDQVGPVDYTVFAATNSFLQKNPEVAQKFTNAVFKALLLTRTAPAAELVALAKPYFPAINEQDAAEVVERYRKANLWRDDPVIYEPSINTLQDILIQGGVQKPDKRVKYSDIVVTTFGEAAKAAIKK